MFINKVMKRIMICKLLLIFVLLIFKVIIQWHIQEGDIVWCNTPYEKFKPPYFFCYFFDGFSIVLVYKSTFLNTSHFKIQGTFLIQIIYIVVNLVNILIFMFTYQIFIKIIKTTSSRCRK